MGSAARCPQRRSRLMPSRTHSSNLRELEGARCHGAALSASKFRGGELQLCCSTATKKSRVRAGDLIPTYHTERAALSCCGPPMSEGHPISMVCSRSGVRLYAATHAPGLVSCVDQHASCKPSSKATMAARDGKSLLFLFL